MKDRTPTLNKSICKRKQIQMKMKAAKEKE